MTCAWILVEPLLTVKSLQSCNKYRKNKECKRSMTGDNHNKELYEIFTTHELLYEMRNDINCILGLEIGIDSLQSISGVHKRLQIWTLTPAPVLNF